MCEKFRGVTRFWCDSKLCRNGGKKIDQRPTFASSPRTSELKILFYFEPRQNLLVVQVFVVKAPWVKALFLTKSAYVLPRLDTVVLGGTSQRGLSRFWRICQSATVTRLWLCWSGDYNLEVDRVDSARIWEECCRLCPSVAYAEVVAERVGLRPFRESTIRYYYIITWLEAGNCDQHWMFFLMQGGFHDMAGLLAWEQTQRK